MTGAYFQCPCQSVEIQDPGRCEAAVFLENAPNKYVNQTTYIYNLAGIRRETAAKKQYATYNVK